MKLRSIPLAAAAFLTVVLPTASAGAQDAGRAGRLPPCLVDGRPVTLVIKTDTTSGWTANGSPVVVTSNAAWANASPATWIGPTGTSAPGAVTYRVSFSAPNMRGPMSVSARWAADNCGVSLQAGTASPVPASTACFERPSPDGKDFRTFDHVTNASFAPADVNNPNPSITFTVANQPGTAVGFAGIFTITAQCTCAAEPPRPAVRR